MIVNEVTQMAVILFANRRLQAHRLQADLDDLAHLLRADLHLSGNFLGSRFTPQVLQPTTADADQAVDRLHHMYWNTDCTRLVSNRTGNRLPNPPRSVRAELVPLRIIDLLHSPDQPDISLLDQVQQAHPAPDILLGHAHYQPQICLSQAPLCLFTIIDQAIAPARHRLQQLGSSALHALCQANFLLRGKQGYTPDLAQVHAHGIVQATLQVGNNNTQAIVQLVPPGISHMLHPLHLILSAELPVNRWLLAWIQRIHTFIIL